MSRSPLTLAALATAAVPDLKINSVEMHTRGSLGNYDSAVLLGDTAACIVRVPNSKKAQDLLETELKALSALSPGIRARLPFEVPQELGTLAYEADVTETFVYSFVPGEQIDPTELSALGNLAPSLGRALSALHKLPPVFVDDYALEHETAEMVRDRFSDVVGRARDTRRVPVAMLDRWAEALDSDLLWDFEPTVVHGDLDEQAVLASTESVTGMLSWSKLRISDPAIDFGWLVYKADDAALDAVFSAYNAARNIGPKALLNLRRRATLYSELSVAEWLLHGVEDNDESVISDAEDMLIKLSDLVSGNYAKALVDPVFEAEVAAESDSTEASDAANPSTEAIEIVSDADGDATEADANAEDKTETEPAKTKPAVNPTPITERLDIILSDN